MDLVSWLWQRMKESCRRQENTWIFWPFLGIRRVFLCSINVIWSMKSGWRSMEEDVREELSGTFLEHAPLVKVSAATGAGLDDLVKEIEHQTRDEVVQKDIHTTSPDSTEYLHFPDLEQSSPEHWCPERSRKKTHFRCIRSEKNVRSEAFRFTEKIRKSVTPDNVWRSTFQM